MGQEAKLSGLQLARDLVRQGVPVELEVSGRSLKAALKRADKLGFAKVAIFGEDELARGVVLLKDLRAGSQKEVSPAQLAEIWNAEAQP
ncbi:Histidine--tRNA ligase [bacterium HR09]|nr:Histidine--tRNA ligase [bacterium HR09]